MTSLMSNSELAIIHSSTQLYVAVCSSTKRRNREKTTTDMFSGFLRISIDYENTSEMVTNVLYGPFVVTRLCMSGFYVN